MNPLDRIKQLQAELARVTAEREQMRTAAENRYEEFRREAHAHFIASGEIEQLRARVAELEAALREEKRIHPEDFQPRDTKNIHYYFEVD